MGTDGSGVCVGTRFGTDTDCAVVSGITVANDGNVGLSPGVTIGVGIVVGTPSPPPHPTNQTVDNTMGNR